MRQLDARRRDRIPIAAYGTATATATVVASLLAVAFVPGLAAPCALGGLALGLLHAFAHDSQGRILDTAVAMGLLAAVFGVLAIGLADVDPRAFPLGLIAVAAQVVWFATFLGIRD